MNVSTAYIKAWAESVRKARELIAWGHSESAGELLKQTMQDLHTTIAQPPSTPRQSAVAWAMKTDKKIRITHMDMSGEEGWRPLVYEDESHTTQQAPSQPWVDVLMRTEMAKVVFEAIRMEVPSLGPWVAFDVDSVQRMADSLKPFTAKCAPANCASSSAKEDAKSNYDAQFETWWETHGQFCRSGGGDYEKTFAYRVWEAATQATQS